MVRRSYRVGFGVVLFTVVALAGSVSPAVSADPCTDAGGVPGTANPGELTCTFSPNSVGTPSYSFAVPAGVTSVSISAAGAQGGTDGVHTGGLGAQASGVFTGVSGQTLTIIVGAAGVHGSSGNTAGGYPDGGAAGKTADATFYSSSGGGRSSVADTDGMLVIAGGGGGAGGHGTETFTGSGGNGDNAGLDTFGAYGTSGRTINGAQGFGGHSGAAPKSVSPQTPGTLGIGGSWTGTCGLAQSGVFGANGSADQGGAGGFGGGQWGLGGAGGGGGGGYAGGGGGGQGGFCAVNVNGVLRYSTGGGGGGGGGSSWVSPDATSPTITQSGDAPQHGGGTVVLTYATAAPVVAGMSAPDHLKGEPFTVSFDRPVMGVSASDFSVTDPASASVGGGLDCLDSSFGVVSCATGPVTWVQYWPNKPLTAGENYTMTVNGASAGVVGTPDGVPVASTQGVVRAQTVFGETDYPVKYGWGTVNNASALGGSYVQEQYPQASEKYSFTGSSLDLVMWAGPDRGTAKILITSPGHPKVKQTINTYAAAPGDLTFSWPALVAGKHTVTITATGANIAPSTNTWVAVDAITVDGSTTTTPKGTARWSDGPGYGYAFTGQKGASVTLRFYGTGVTWNALFGPNDGKATVTVDGVVYGTYDLYAAGYSFQDIPIAGVTLNPTFHILKITVAGTKQAASSGTIITLHQLTVL